MFLLLATAQAAIGMDVGVGLRQDDNPDTGRRLSINASARRHFGPYVAAEAGVSARLPLGSEVGRYTHALAAILVETGSTTFSQPVDVELGSLALHAQFSPWKDPHAVKVGMWPYALVGVDLRLVEYAQATLNEDYVDGVAGAEPATIDETSRERRVLPSPTVGLGFDVWFADRFGVRMVVNERVSLDQEPTTSGTALVSAMLRF